MGDIVSITDLIAKKVVYLTALIEPINQKLQQYKFEIDVAVKDAKRKGNELYGEGNYTFSFEGEDAKYYHKKIENEAEAMTDMANQENARLETLYNAIRVS